MISCGLACQFQNNDSTAHVPVCDLGPYIQDALDLIEFANGAVTSKWGKVRAEMGHPAPFGLKLLAVGNEQWGPEYPSRLEPFITALRKAHPEIRIIGSAGPNSEGKQFDYLWPEMRKLKADLVDEHFYRPEKWFLSQGARYDSYDRKGPKVFAGEYACHGVGKKWNHFNASLMEAAFMTGVERNADVVHMATYAPLFAHVDAWQWRPDLIWYDNLRVALTASYYVQQLFSTNKGTHVLSLTMDGKQVTGAEGQNGLFASAVTDLLKQEIIVKVVNTSDKIQNIILNIEGLKKQQKLSEGRCYSLQSSDPYAENSVEDPGKIQPKKTEIQPVGNSINSSVGARSLYVMVFKIL
ncbi:MAG TPA: alpha-L-arabinofuranosidase A [Prolixibacteraceae bacterium]|nr:alpha-L-arabinofuranosidase A [Prolixibacteraceae bacterium]